MGGANRTVPATASHEQRSADCMTVLARESVWQVRHLNYEYAFQGILMLRPWRLIPLICINPFRLHVFSCVAVVAPVRSHDDPRVECNAAMLDSMLRSNKPL